MNILEQIQALQFVDRSNAEARLADFIRETFDLDVLKVELRVLAVSLNSLNGFITLNNHNLERLFFKTHTEPGGIIQEYYNAGVLAEAGYPVVQPIYRSTEAGKQFLIYPVVTDDSVFDVARIIENGMEYRLAALTQAQHAADDELLSIYRRTLDWQDEASAAAAPIHQLFHHRLWGGRLKRFYSDEVLISLPMVGEMSMGEVCASTWTINGQVYAETLDHIIGRAVGLLQPGQPGASVIGHGDAHNGNVFLKEREGNPSLLYFDPAFAGRHHPLLDLTKPLFHNVFAMWMYFPAQIGATLNIRLHREGERFIVEHDYVLHAVRRLFLDSKVERVLVPILCELQARGWLREDWRAFLKAALFCCPLLTMNLGDATKYPPEIVLLGLAMAVEMGSESYDVRSLIDQTLDIVEDRLHA